MSGLLTVSDVRFGYSDLTVVWDVSLEVRPGRACVLVGRNGAGKTTLLSGIAGMLACEHGTITLGDTRIDRMPVHQRVRHGLSFVQEGKRVLRDLSVRENLLLGTFGIRLSRSEQRQSLAEMCDRFPHLARRLASPAGSLSGGQQQMLAIAQGLISRPGVLLLDEPSSGLAPVIVEEVMEMIAQLRQEGLGILLVEEHVDEALTGIADDIVMLEQGRVVLSASASALSQEDLVHGMRLGSASFLSAPAAET